MSVVAFVPFLGVSMGATTLVGNELGNNNPQAAARVPRACAVLHPCIAALIACLLWVPYSRNSIVQFMSQGGSQELQ